MLKKGTNLVWGGRIKIIDVLFHKLPMFVDMGEGGVKLGPKVVDVLYGRPLFVLKVRSFLCIFSLKRFEQLWMELWMESGLSNVHVIIFSFLFKAIPKQNRVVTKSSKNVCLKYFLWKLNHRILKFNFYFHKIFVSSFKFGFTLLKDYGS